MNELTIEQKAQRYDEAIAHAKLLLKTIGNATLGNLVLKNEFEIMFPELTESEDEKIRKEIVSAINIYCSEYHRGTKVRNDMLAWLEKQDNKDKLIKELSEYKSKYIRETLEKVLTMNNRDDERLRKTTIDFLKEFADKGYENAIECIDWLKKQGEQKSAIYDSNVLEKHITKNSISELANSILIRNGWKVIEQNLTDKAEPKFHEGEWLCENEPNNYARFIQILNVQGKERYRISRDIHNDEDIVEFDFVEKYYHKFDIKDAKPGDVLASKNGAEILIFRKLDSSRSFSSYYNIKGRGEIGWSNRSFVPATKEQRDLLFSKMKEEGYKWDDEKKELKKIKQKHTPKYKVGDTIYYNSFGEVKSMIVANVVTDNTDNPMYEDENGNAVFEKDLIEQKSAWSKEDDRIYYSLLADIRTRQDGSTSTLEAYYNEQIDWLKSLKDRVSPRPKKEEDS